MKCFSKVLPLSILLSGLQAAEPAAIKESEAFRQSLKGEAELNVEEALPDPVKFPALHEQERAIQTKERIAPRMIAGQAFYEGSPGVGGTEAMIRTLGSAKSLRVSKHKKDDRFQADWLLTWESGEVVRHAMISLGGKELMFVKDDLHLRYDLTPEALAVFKERLSYLRFFRPDALDLTKPLLAPLSEGAAITVHEGSGHGVITQEEFAARGKIEISGYSFLKSGPAPPSGNPERLSRLIASKDLIALWGGQKLCGGFEPDFAVTWQAASGRVSLLVCYTCREARFVSEKIEGFMLYDLQKNAFQELRTELNKFGLKKHFER